MKKVTLIAIVLCLLGSGLAWGSGSSGVPGSSASAPPTPVTQTIKCEVVQVKDGQVYVVADRDNRPFILPLDEDTKITAQDKKAFDGRKKLVVEDLQVGQALRVTTVPTTRQVVRVRVLKKG